MKKLRWLKSFDGSVVGEEFQSGEKSAENFVSQGYAEYIVERIPVKKEQPVKTENKVEPVKNTSQSSKSLPSKLRDPALIFCLVEKPVQGDSKSGKKPFQQNWPNLNIKWDNPALIKWIGMGGNYGVIGGGDNNLVIIDFDEKELQDELESKLPETFTVKTGSGLLHKYYFTDGGKSFKILNEKGDTRADVQSDGKQVVGPGSRHYTGNNYTIENNLPIATIKYEDIKNLLIPYNTFKKNNSVPQQPKPIAPQQSKIFSGDDDFQEDLFSSVTFESLLSEFGVDTSKSPTNCPFHSSKGGKCFGWDEEKAHCFHCEGAWNKMSWIKAHQSCDAKGAIEWLANREGRTDELETSREKWRDDKIREELYTFKETVQGGSDAEFKEEEINWTNENLPWEEMKEDVRKIIKNTNKMFIVCSKDDIITGKPQLIHATKKTITLVRLTEKEIGRKGQEEMVQKIKFLDESADKRTDGTTIKSWSEEFWTYRIISNDVEYYLLSKEELPIQSCIITGMKMKVNDIAEMNQSLKVKSLSTLFFVNSFEPAVKIVSKEELVKFTKENKITEEVWTDFLDYHRIHSRNRFPYLSNMIRSAQILSGKKDEWPLHVGIIGPAGTRKSMGYVETIAWKFDEEPAIIEGANSRIKGLSPSFKEKPANIGYLAKAERMGFVDELGKMIEFESNRHDGQVSNVLGELNFLLDHKKRTVGSGNDNQCVVQANAKFLFVSNPVRKKRCLRDHVGTVDPTTMSRILWWVQNKAEQEFVISKDGIKRINQLVGEEIPPTPIEKKYTLNTKILYPLLYKCRGECVFTREEYLTLFDSVNSFLCEINEDKIEELSKMVTKLAEGKMQDIWKPRGPHHIELLIDGFIKHRCLFKDYDSTFTAKPEDYELAQRFLIEMVERWDTDLSMGII